MAGSPLGSVPLAVAILAAALSGCTADDGAGDAAPAGRAGNVATGNRTAPVAALWGSAPPVVNLEQAGSLAPTDVCLVTCNEARVAIGERIPAGFGYDIWANVTWTTDATEELGDGRHLYAYLEATPKEYSTYEEDWGTGVYTLHVVLSRVTTDPVDVVVGIGYPGAGPVPFTVAVTIAPLVDRTNSMVPLAVSFDAAATHLLVRGGEGGTLRLWDAKDRFVGDFKLEPQVTQVPLAAGGGESVLQFVDAAAPVHLFGLQPNGTRAPTVRNLATVFVFGEAHPMNHQGSTQWTTQVDTVPLQAGIYLQSMGDGMTSWQPAATLDSPAGRVMELERGDLNCLYCNRGLGGGGAQFTLPGEPGLPTLVAGTYSGTIDAAASAQAMVGTLYAVHVRA